MRMTKAQRADYALIEKGLRWVQKQLRSRKHPVEFDMSQFASSSCKITDGKLEECGTAHCIGGWLDVWLFHEVPERYVGLVDHVMDFDGTGERTYYRAGDPTHRFNTPEGVQKRLRYLFYPEPKNPGRYYIEYEVLTKKQAIAAIDNFLEGKKNPWSGVVMKDQIKDSWHTS